MRPPILDQLSAAKKAQLLDELVEFLATPSFGAWPKREIEVRVVAALYERELRDGSLSVARLAEELTVTRARGRSLVLEARTRLLSGPEDRTKTLETLLKRWPQQAQVDESDGRLRLVVEDPFVRDLLRNHAYAAGIPLDTSFATEIVSLRWSDYASLLASGPAGGRGGGGREGRRRRDPARPRRREGDAGRVRAGDEEMGEALAAGARRPPAQAWHRVRPREHDRRARSSRPSRPVAC